VLLEIHVLQQLQVRLGAWVPLHTQLEVAVKLNLAQYLSHGGVVFEGKGTVVFVGLLAVFTGISA
jgi:hypothetical protein